LVSWKYTIVKLNSIKKQVKIRQAVPDDFAEIDSFDVFAGDRKTEIQRDEVWVAILEGSIAGYITFNRSLVVIK
jgi:hypothetical protein